MTYWHFREHLEQCKIPIVVEPTKDQIIDLLILPIAAMEFEKLQTNIMGPTRNTVKRSVGKSEQHENGLRTPNPMGSGTKTQAKNGKTLSHLETVHTFHGKIKRVINVRKEVNRLID